MVTTSGLAPRTAHESGDGVTVRHCPFCGAGQVIGRSDGNTECSFCNSAFLVRVQPLYSAFPQSVGGVPVQIPGMPPPADPMAAQGLPPGAGGADDEGGDGDPFGQDGGAAEDDPAKSSGGTAAGGPPQFGGGEGGKGGSDSGSKKDGGPPKKESFLTGRGPVLDRDAYLAYLAGRVL